MATKRERCAWCGLIDHHLIDETCPSCREVVQTINFTGNPSFDQMQINVKCVQPKLKEYDNVPLGVEAANVMEVYRDNH